MNRRALLLLLMGFSTVPVAFARPLLTEEVAALGPAVFDASVGGSLRWDTFESPKTEYRTVAFPIRARIGLFRGLDFGFKLTHLSHSLKTEDSKLKGSRPALFSPEIKYAFNDNVGLLAIWHASLKEKPNQELPIARGNDVELLALFKVPVAWPTHVNIGYLFRKDYQSRFGVEGRQLSDVNPSDVFETKASIEIPLKASFSLLTEAAYYKIGKRKIDNVELVDSDGEALDILGGLVWSYQGWNLGAGVSFGLLDESHTSFDLERGSGDVTFRFNIAYKLKAKKPTA